MDQQFRSLERSIPHRSSTYPWSDRALSTSKWSPQHASSSPSKPHSPHFLASSSSGRSAHCPVKSVTGLATFDPPRIRYAADSSLQLSAPCRQKRANVNALSSFDGSDTAEHCGKTLDVVSRSGLGRLVILHSRAKRLQRCFPLDELDDLLLHRMRLLAPPLQQDLT